MDPRITPRTLPAGAVVSLLSVLGDAGITNNYTYQVWSVIAASQDRPAGIVPAFEHHEETDTVYRIFAMPSEVLAVPDRADVLDPAYPYSRATVEAALCHLVYLCHAGAVGSLPYELELDDLDRPRITRIATAMGIVDEMETYLAGVLDLNREQDVAPGLGI